jgi:Inner membrane component of T3SS, cytoplasmic domain/Domain of unknown function (DUF1707)
MDSQAGQGTPPPVPLRASDAERDQVVGELRERFAEGLLTQDSFLYRMDVALHARERGELAGLVADLPRPARRRGLRDGLAAVAARGRSVAHWASGRWQAAIQPGAGHPAGRTPPWRSAGQWPVLFFPPGQALRFTIGRDDGCDLVLRDISVSRLHARLERSGTGWLLEDLGSTNGTRLNGWRVSGQVLVQPGDHVSFGGAGFLLADAR